MSHFWSRWHKEYLVGLREVHRSDKRESPNILKGDVVLVHDDNLKRGMWKMAIVEDLVVGKDGVVKGAKLRKAGKGKPEFIGRPLQKLYPLECVRAKTGVEIEEEGNNGEECETQGERCAENPPGVRRPPHAAARDAQCRTRLLLDSF